jgi:hypothetical protein
VTLRSEVTYWELGIPIGMSDLVPGRPVRTLRDLSPKNDNFIPRQRRAGSEAGDIPSIPDVAASSLMIRVYKIVLGGDDGIVLGSSGPKAYL